MDSSEIRSTAAYLSRDGIVDVPGLTSAQVADVWVHLHEKPRWRGHVKQNGLNHGSEEVVTCWGMDDVVTAPHLFELGLTMTPIVERYLTSEPVMYSMNAFTTYPSQKPLNPDIQLPHRDHDDVQFLALFVYLTDVLTPEDGSHEFMVKSHFGTDGTHRQTVLGPAGTAFLADTRGLHLGRRPEQARRTLAWVRWGVSDPPQSYLWDRLSAVPKAMLGDRYPTDPRVQRMVRWVVQ